MQSTALYRLPYADTYTEVYCQSEPIVLRDVAEIGNKPGFVFAPFKADDEHPIVLIPADHLTTHPCPKVSVSSNVALSLNECPTEDYSADFAAFHSAIRNGSFSKLVLARKDDQQSVNASPEHLFFTACQMFPRAMVMLISTSATGTWLIATPEVLLEGDGTRWLTMALAGTMPYNEVFPQWSIKNQQEQHIVEQFIADAIAPFATDIIKDGPHTVRAANLIHLCTTFRFHLSDDATVGNVVSALHPTPAVSGLPRTDAISFICANEHLERSYYSGFAGPVGIGCSTHLYVSLRLMQIRHDHCTLFAGGGIMPDSELQSEWNETENKLSTMRSCIQTSSM